MAVIGDSGDALRIDLWLWHVRFCKTRGIAQAKASKGRIYLNGNRVQKPGARVRVGDMMTLTAGGNVVDLRILKLGERRGPAQEARTLYEIVEDS